MRFVIDETSIKLGVLDPDGAIEAIEVLLDFLDEIRHQRHPVCYSDELFWVSVCGSKSLYDMYDARAEIPIPHVVQERIAVAFSMLPKWQDLEYPWPESFDVSVSGGPVESAPSVAWAHTQRVAKHGAGNVACIFLWGAGRPEGLVKVAAAGGSTALWFASELRTAVLFFRALIRDNPANHAILVSLAPSAFPDVDFVDGCFAGIKDMRGAYEALVPKIVDHLSVMSDHGKRIFAQSWQQAPAEFGGYGVEISDESGNTKQNSGARKARTRRVEGKEAVFWWHSKLSPNQNRIHFLPDRVSAGGKLLVGIFCDHLVT